MHPTIILITVETVLKWIGGLGFLASLAFTGYILLLCKRKKGIPRKSTEQLREMILKSNNNILYAPAVRELAARGEDVTFTLPNVIGMLLDKNKLIRTIGWGIITEHFPTMTNKVEFGKRILFLPIGGSFRLLRSHPIVAELRHLAEQATKDRANST